MFIHFVIAGHIWWKCKAKFSELENLCLLVTVNFTNLNQLAMVHSIITLIGSIYFQVMHAEGKFNIPCILCYGTEKCQSMMKVNIYKYAS